MDTSDREKLFWNNYLTVLSEDQIKPPLHTWYVLHCESFIRRIKAIDALKLLFKGIHAPLYLQVDWDYWKLSCQDLSNFHDTNYRSNHTIENQKKPSSSPPDPLQRKILANGVSWYSSNTWQSGARSASKPTLVICGLATITNQPLHQPGRGEFCYLPRSVVFRLVFLRC